MILSLTAVGYALTFDTVTIIDGEEEQSIKTREKTVKDVLEQEGIDYIPEDSITPTLDTNIENGSKILIKRAVSVTIEADGKVKELLTPAQDVKAVLEEVGIRLGKKDEVTPALDTELKKNMNIQITRAIPYTIEVDGEEIEGLTTAPTVQEILEEAEITLEEKDKIEPALDEKIEEDMEIKITRVTEETITEEEEIDYDTIRKNTSSLNKGTTKITQNGQQGKKENTIKVVYEDGEEVSREITESKVIKEPVDKIVKVGTKVVPKKTTASRGSSASRGSTTSQSKSGSYRTLTVTATGYSPEDPGVGTRTSTGAKLAKGVIAVDPSVIPYGSKIYVPGYGYGTALDTGGAIKGNKIDLAFGTKSQALGFGRKTVTIRIYD